MGPFFISTQNSLGRWQGLRGFGATSSVPALFAELKDVSDKVVFYLKATEQAKVALLAATQQGNALKAQQRLLGPMNGPWFAANWSRTDFTPTEWALFQKYYNTFPKYASEVQSGPDRNFMAGSVQLDADKEALYAAVEMTFREQIPAAQLAFDSAQKSLEAWHAKHQALNTAYEVAVHAADGAAPAAAAAAAARAAAARATGTPQGAGQGTEYDYRVEAPSKLPIYIAGAVLGVATIVLLGKKS